MPHANDTARALKIEINEIYNSIKYINVTLTTNFNLIEIEAFIKYTKANSNLFDETGLREDKINYSYKRLNINE